MVMTSTPKTPALIVLSAMVSALWLGMLVGVSFLATPVKFLAPSLTLPVALDVGRQTFGVFNKVELGFCFVLVAMVLFGKLGRLTVVAVVVTASIVLFEAVWLLPVLDQRVGAILAGNALAPSTHHRLYIALESVKSIALMIVLARTSWVAIRGSG